ncbi:hypothetical protein ES288_D08G167800v1 [Gossypium darwinii]|uniref:Uncharacterized protein n=1 Tax=Gossypium darwinii TaxID=34276 RepID=A0A5D2BQB1_GOSDA|nr:hypothetical protein ES288_D08G167800v1 [Gossypium darwinii]
MATILAFSTPLHLISKTHFKSPKNLFFYPNSIHFQTKVSTFSSNNLTLSFKNSKTLYGTWKLKSAEEEETAVVEQEREETTVAEQESVSVPVSPSDTLRMYFQGGLPMYVATRGLYGFNKDDEDDSVAKMKAAEEALEAKQKVTNSLSATYSFFFLSCFIIL